MNVLLLRHLEPTPKNNFLIVQFIEHCLCACSVLSIIILTGILPGVSIGHFKHSTQKW